MLTRCVLIYPYYNNRQMLDIQVKNWNQYPPALREAVELIVVDDCSKESPLPSLERCKLTTQCYRLVEDIPWNMHQCRNIGAKLASNRGENDWLFMSDIDIVLPPAMAEAMLARKLDDTKHYTFERTFMPELTERKVHPNTFLTKFNAFWEVNGYDLDLTPIGGGGYGGDNQFMRQLAAVASREHLADVVLVGYGRRSREGKPYITDADTQELDRVSWHQKYVVALNRKKQDGDMKSKNPIRTAYTRIL